MPRIARVTPPTVTTLVDDEIDTSPTSTSNEQRASSTSDINGVATAEQDDQDSTTIHLSSDLIHYFQSINVDSFSEEKKDAIAIILDKIILDTEQNRSIAIPAHLFAKSNSKIRKEMITFLVERIPGQERQKRVGDASLKKWSVASNAYRALMFFTKERLGQIATELN